MQRFTVFFLLLFMLTACRKKEDPVTPAGAPRVALTFDNRAGDQPLSLGDTWYQTENGDSLKVTYFKYYITNIVLKSDEGDYTEPESYHLIDAADTASLRFSFEGVPARTYNKISFLIGVDRNRNISGAQTGALDPMHGMFWDWNQGYIMARLEGVSPQAPGSTVSYHIAGFQGEYNVVMSRTLDLPQPLQVKNGGTYNIHITADMLEWFKTPSLIKLAELSSIGNSGPEALRVATNYYDMFHVVHIDQ